MIEYEAMGLTARGPGRHADSREGWDPDEDGKGCRSIPIRGFFWKAKGPKPRSAPTGSPMHC